MGGVFEIVGATADLGITEAKIAAGAVTQTKLGAEAVNESELQVSNAPVNGYFLSAQSGNTGGMTWAVASSPEVYGFNTDSNGNLIVLLQTVVQIISQVLLMQHLMMLFMQLQDFLGA